MASAVSASLKGLAGATTDVLVSKDRSNHGTCGQKRSN